MLKPCLYQCRVSHVRFKPKRYQFVHDIFMFCLDITDMTALNRLFPMMGVERAGLYQFFADDHLPGPAARPLHERLLSWLREQGHNDLADASRRILLVTQLRVLGYGFNPVCFYFCLDAEQRPVCAIAEVRNTFGELKPYVVPLSSDTENRFERTVDKLFYVSPFLALDDVFAFRLGLPADTIGFEVDTLDADGSTLLASRMTGKRTPLTIGNLLRLTIRHPWIPLQVIALIHWHALKLWLMRIPYFAKEANPHLQQGLFYPHSKTFKGVTP
jgi:DUF1365 family protein